MDQIDMGIDAATDHIAQLASDLEACARELEALSLRLTTLPPEVLDVLIKDIVFPPNWGINTSSLAGNELADEQGRDTSIN
jgi:hypothetical protein